jgi:hypothetical protein
MEGLIRFFKARCPQSPLGQARAASMLQLEAILDKRCRMMFQKPYLILAHFAGNIDTASAAAEAVAPDQLTLTLTLTRTRRCRTSGEDCGGCGRRADDSRQGCAIHRYR